VPPELTIIVENTVLDKTALADAGEPASELLTLPLDEPAVWYEK